MRFVDSHLHLDGKDAQSLVEFASTAGVVLLACGVDRKTSAGVLRLAGRDPQVVKPFVGVHPSEALKSANLSWLGTAAIGASGIGEIGLDPSYSTIGERSGQMKAFGNQIEVARRLGKPVQVHSRGGEMKCIEVLGTAGTKQVLMHWLQSEEALPKAMEKGYFVSFGPALLYSKKLQRMAVKADPDAVLVESDSPVGYSPLGGLHGPSLVPSVAFKLAELWGKPFTYALTATVQNAMRFLGISEKG